jgi:hypothetical protein
MDLKPKLVPPGCGILVRREEHSLLATLEDREGSRHEQQQA